MKRTLAFVSALGIVFFLTQPGYAGKPVRTDPVDRTTVHYGNHVGEVRQLEVSVSFYGQYGETVTDENGTFYNVFGYTFFEPKIYPPQYWGVFPLYFFEAPTGIRVSVKNVGPRRITNLRVRTEAFCLLTDGATGVQLAPTREADMDVEVGETKTVDASITPSYVEGADSGLDRLIVKILHPNEGGGPGNSDPALIMIKEAVFCPPKNEGVILDILEQILGE